MMTKLQQIDKYTKVEWWAPAVIGMAIIVVILRESLIGAFRR